MTLEVNTVFISRSVFFTRAFPNHHILVVFQKIGFIFLLDVLRFFKSITLLIYFMAFY